MVSPRARAKATVLFCTEHSSTHHVVKLIQEANNCTDQLHLSHTFDRRFATACLATRHNATRYKDNESSNNCGKISDQIHPPWQVAATMQYEKVVPIQ